MQITKIRNSTNAIVLTAPSPKGSSSLRSKPRLKLASAKTVRVNSSHSFTLCLTESSSTSAKGGPTEKGITSREGKQAKTETEHVQLPFNQNNKTKSSESLFHPVSWLVCFCQLIAVPQRPSRYGKPPAGYSTQCPEDSPRFSHPSRTCRALCPGQQQR